MTRMPGPTPGACNSSTSARDPSSAFNVAEAHLHHSADLAQHLRVSLDSGLAADEVRERQQRHGPNRLPERRRAAWRRVVDQFRDFMILVLLGAAVLSGLIGDLVDTLAILVIVLLNAAIGSGRNGAPTGPCGPCSAWPRRTPRCAALAAVQVVHTDHLVPGDVVLLEAGNLVPADLRLHEVAQLKVDESALTGESVTVDKRRPLAAGEHALGDRSNMAFKGTLVTHGRARGLVVATGAATQLGQVATLLGGTERAHSACSSGWRCSASACRSSCWRSARWCSPSACCAASRCC